MINLSKILLLLLITTLLFTQTAIAQTVAQELASKDIHQLTALEVLDLKQQQKLTTEQHILALLELARDSTYLTFLNVDDIAAQAKFLDSVKVDKSSALHGIPLIVSDNINIAGLPTTLGLASLINHVPEQNAHIISRLEAQGAFVMAKTPNTPFGLEIIQESIRNPYNQDAIAGSSQAGTAAAVASGIAPIGIGTDALGSARMAASLTGIIAFKPSQDRYSLESIATTSSTETPAIFARSVQDIILVDSLLSDKAPDLTSSFTTSTTETDTGANLQDLKIGIAQDFFYYPLERNTEKLLAKFITKFIVDGEIEMIETEVNQLSKLMPTLKETLIDYELRTGVSDYLDNISLNLDDVFENLTSDIALDALERSSLVTQSDYETVTQEELETLRFEFNDFIERTEIEAFILPTTPSPAKLISENKSISDSLENYTRNTQPGSFAGLPSITLPIGFTDAGLPVGIMLEGAVGDDSRLLSIALAVEALIGNIPTPADLP